MGHARYREAGMLVSMGSSERPGRVAIRREDALDVRSRDTARETWCQERTAISDGSDTIGLVSAD